MIAAPEPERLRVLLVDDDQDQYVLTKEMLGDDRTSQFDVDWAASYDDGLERLAGTRYDVALVDYRIGARDGIELLRSTAVRQADVPAIMLTAAADADADAMTAGAVDYLVKSEVTAPMLSRAVRYAVERHRAVAMLKHQEGSLRALLADSEDVILLTNRDGDILFASDAVRHLDDCATDELVGIHFLANVDPLDRERVRRVFDACAYQEEGRAFVEYRQRHRDGAWRFREATIVNRLARRGVAAMVITYRDVTARKTAEDHQALLAAIVEGSDDAIFSGTPDGFILSWNEAAEKLYGYTADEVVGRHVSMIVKPDAPSAASLTFAEVQHGRSVRSREVTCVRKDGSALPVVVTVSPIRDRNGQTVAASVVAHDITERKRTQAALLEREAEYRATFDEAPVGIAQTSPVDGRWLRINETFRRMLGYSNAELETITFADITHPQDVRRTEEARASLLAGRGRIDHYSAEKRYRRADGTYFWAHLTVSLHRDTGGEPKYFIAVVEDIAQRKQAQQDLAHLFNLSPDMIVMSNYEGFFTHVNSACTRVLGFPAEVLKAHPFLSLVHPDDGPSTERELARLAAGETTVGFTNRYRTADGSYRWIEWNAIADPSSRVIYAVARDQTDKRLLEEQLRQAQKMEAIGRLAGSVAHDFNNLLTVIVGFSELTMGMLPDDSPCRPDVQQVLDAGRSGSTLTRQLLAFSRKQLLEPQFLDLNDLVNSMQRLISHVAGEHVTLDVALDRDLGTISADRGQVEQILMNLAVNARDAMPDGGRLRIATERVELDQAFVASHPGASIGRYVRLTVSDTGVGMGREVLEHLFEPFFTTKGPGKGTGLGLATVYGIVKQSGGNIWVESARNQGATFVIDFPSAGLATVAGTAVDGDSKVVAGTEAILVVEDQSEVRDAVRQVLQRQGYTVLVAEDGPTALEILRHRPEPVHLLLTDVVMPKMRGRELAQRVVEQRGSIRVLYMSGYPDDVVASEGALEASGDFISKPFTPEQLLARVRELLNRQR